MHKPLICHSERSENVVKIFGTDGIRGKANTGWLSPENLLKLGKIIGLRYSGNVIIGRDTRRSGQMIEQALSAGMLSQGLNVTSVGVISTPGLSYLTQHGAHKLGIMISASHNPADDNGIKIFAHNGLKITGDAEQVIEKYLHSGRLSATADKTIKPDVVYDGRAEVNHYSEYLCRKVFNHTSSLNGFRLLVDCANGSFSDIAPAIFERLGAEVIPLNCRPDGDNINLNCGALYPHVMARAVVRHKADAGFSFDGDGDRLIMADDKGHIVDGDFILAIAARYLKKHRRLPHHTIVGTIMTNSGLVESLQSIGVKLVTTSVGDKYVLDKMRADGYVLGGEPSGHIIFSDYSLNGDGLLTALVMLKILKSERKPLSTLAQCLTKYPQVLVNVRVKSKPPIETIRPLQAKADEAIKILGRQGRISLRYSGTEPLLRIMIEGKRKKQIQLLANQMADIVKNNL